MEPPRLDGKAAIEPPAPEEKGEAVVVVSHETLFAAPAEPRCDACGAPLPVHEDGDDDSYDVPGEGVYVWTRGEQVRFEKAPLCGDCASAIGVTALARWEIEEEEG
jgi:hypothetical protein